MASCQVEDDQSPSPEDAYIKYYGELTSYEAADIEIVSEGGEANSLIVFGSKLSTNGDRDFYLQLGVPEFEEVVGSTAEDLLVGGLNADRLIGFAGRDYAFGGGGADVFVLGDFGGKYYTDDGWNDSVYIDDFTIGEDQLQLNGSASDYSVTTTETGSWILAEGDAIAFLNGVQAVDLESFEYLSL